MKTIEELRKMIEGPSDDARYAGWHELYASDLPQAREELERIILATDPILKLLLSRFLADINEDRAVSYLVRLIADENTVVAEAAEKNFLKNIHPYKLKVLMKLVDSPSSRARTFAISELALGGQSEILDRLIELLPDADEALLVTILTAFRLLAEKRLAPLLAQYMEDPRDEIRYRSVLAYGALLEAGHTSFKRRLIKGLEDPAPRVRQAVLWCLRRSLSRLDLKILFKTAETDPDSQVREEAIVGLGLFPNKKVISEILTVLSREKDREVLLKGEGVLIGMNPTKLVGALRKILFKGKESLKEKALLILSEFEFGSLMLCQWVLQALEGEKNDKKKVSYIEALGHIGRGEAVSPLTRHLHGNPLLGYTAITSILKIWGNDLDAPYSAFLTDLKLNVLIKQMVLRHVVKRRLPIQRMPGMEEILNGFLSSQNLNLRYLATQALMRANSRASVEPMIHALASESDPTTLRLLKQGLTEQLPNDVPFFLNLLEKNREDQKIVALMLTMLKESTLTPEQNILLVTGLLQPEMHFIPSPFLKDLTEYLSRQIFRRRLPLNRLLEAVATTKGGDILLSALTETLRGYEETPYALPVEALGELLLKGKKAENKAIVDLLGLSRSRQAIPHLMEALLRPTEVEAAHVRRVINSLVFSP